MPPNSKIVRDVIHNFISATEDLISTRLSPAYHRLSSEERGAIVYYLEELHEFLEQEEANSLCQG